MKIHSNLAVSDTGFIFNPSNGDSFSTNQTGAEIVRLMKEGKKPAEIKQLIVEKYETDAKSFEKDYDDFMAHLRDHFLVSHE